MFNYTPGAHTWTADFTGLAVIIQWGGGGGGAAGEALTRGGKGGGSGALAVDVLQVVTGQVYSYYNGVGGTGGSYSGDKTGIDGEASYFGGGTTCRAAGGHGAGPSNTGGAGGQVADSLGRSRVSGGNGLNSAGNLHGGLGGDAPNQGDWHGGTGGADPGQSGSNPGNAPGGGGSGGGHTTGSNGGNGGSGGTVIFQSTDPTIPGYYLLGVDESYNFSAAGTYDDFVPSGDGYAWFEAVGSGGGGRGGNGLALQGGHGASGGAWAATLRQVFRDVAYRRVVPAGGAGTALNGSAGANGADASWTVTPLRIVQKQLTSNVATLWTCAVGSSTPQKHGMFVGESVVIAGVDATFNGTYTITAVAADRLSFSYAKTAANVAATAVTPTGTSAGLTNPFTLAKGGLGATGTYTGGTPVAGGQASACIGDQKTSGDRGQAVASSTTTAGGSAGGGALPLGEQGGWGGNTTLAASNAGDPGGVPGGGGGGGAGKTGGNGGNGARGAAVVRWILELHGIWVGGERKSVTRVKVWTGGSAHTVTNVSVWNSGKHSTHRTMVHPESLKRRYPTYLASNRYGFFDRNTGTFNWKDGAPHLLAAIANNSLDIVVSGDSVAEGWTSFDGLVTGTKDFPNAFPRFGRDLLVTASGMTLGGTGLIRPNTVSGADPEWSVSGWSTSAGKHYLSSSNTGHIATFTPGNTSNSGGPVQITGTRAAVVYSGAGVVIRIDGTVVATTSATANTAILARWESGTLSDAAHVIDVRPSGTGTSLLFGADVYKPTGIRVHNMAQGGAKASGGTGQDYWGDTATAAPTNMTNCYKQSVMVPSSKTYPDAHLIFLGGNDSNAGTDAATIKAGFKNMGLAYDQANTDIILMPDVWTSDRNVALMDLCIEQGWAMIDFFYLSRALSSIFGLNYNGDAFGHLNTTGAQWAGGMVKDAFRYNPNP